MITGHRGHLGLGLQLERTALAWRRTSLAFLVAGATGGRVLAERSPTWAAATVTLGLVLAAAGGLLAARRLHRTALAIVAAPGTPRLPGGAVLACAALGQAVAGLTALVLVLR